MINVFGTNFSSIMGVFSGQSAIPETLIHQHFFAHPTSDR